MGRKTNGALRLKFKVSGDARTRETQIPEAYAQGFEALQVNLEFFRALRGAPKMGKSPKRKDLGVDALS